jgi:DNA-binding NarL/FixJ family response regulator
MTRRVMLVDDQDDIRMLLRMVLTASGAVDHICEAATGAEAIALLEECDPSIIILDEMMPGMNGVETCSRIMALRPEQRVILCSAYLDADIATRARAAGAIVAVHKDGIRGLPDVIRELAA